MLTAEPPEHLGLEQAAFDLGFLKAENVGSFFAQEVLDDADARANAVDIPRCDAGASHAVGSIGARRRSQCDCGLVPPAALAAEKRAGQIRSEEHTSELQSLMRISYAVFCLKKKKQKQHYYTYKQYRKSHTQKLQKHN